MARVGPRRDIVLLLLPLVLPNHESRRARAGEEGDDGRAYGHDEILDECLHVLFHVIFHKQYDFKLLILAIRSFPQKHFSFFQLEKYFSPTRKVIFQRFLNHDAKIQKQPPAVMRWRLMP